MLSALTLVAEADGILERFGDGHGVGVRGVAAMAGGSGAGAAVR